MQLQKSTTYRLKKKSDGFTPAEELKPKKSKSAETVEGNKTIVPKEFIWDRMVTVLVTCILGLTVVDLVAEFFSQSTSTVVCRTPTTFSVVQSSFVNSFCFSSLSLAQYYPLFLVIHGLVILSPHQFWSWLFAGHIDFFFDLAKALDRLKNPSSGEYDRKNVAIVTKLEGEFLLSRIIYRCYFGKLILQSVAAALSLCISWGVFEDFTITFLCSSNASAQLAIGDNNFSDLWPTYFECTFIPFRLFSVLRYTDTVLLILALGILLYAVFWCIKGHCSELGTNEIAMFAFTSCLPPESYVFPKLCTATGACQLKRLFSPSINNDLDFLLLRLYQSDSGHGKVFRELQISKAYRSLHIHDHKLLHLLINLQQDWRLNRDAMERKLQRCNGDPKNNTTCKGIRGNRVSPYIEEHHLELRDYFRRCVGEYKNPELLAYSDYKEDLGNIDLNDTEWVQIQSIRAEFYEFVKCAPHIAREGVEAGYALDVSFGSSGFTLALARAFEKVRSVNFHPFYQEDMPKRTAFYTNYECIMLPQDVFSRSNIVLNKAYEYICQGISNKKVLNFIVVGPINDKSKLATVNLLISHLLAADCIQTNAMLLTVRPLQIAHKSTSEMYFSYEPSKPMFVASPERLDDIPVNCAGTVCKFKFSIYSFLDGT